MAFAFLDSLFPNDVIGIDPGAFSTKVCVRGQGVVLESRDLLLDYAKPDECKKTLSIIFGGPPVKPKWRLIYPRVGVSIRMQGDETAQRAVMGIYEAQARQIFAIDEASLAAIGCGVDINSEGNALILDFGLRETRIYGVDRFNRVFERRLDAACAVEEARRAMDDLPINLRGFRKFAVGGGAKRPGLLDALRTGIGPIESPPDPQFAVVRGLEKFLCELSRMKFSASLATPN